jgi:hypothetical protein
LYGLRNFNRDDAFKAPTCTQTQFGKRGAQRRCRAHGENIFWIDAIMSKNVQRNVELAPRGVSRKPREHVCYRLRTPRFRRDHLTYFAAEKARGQTKDCSGGT